MVVARSPRGEFAILNGHAPLLAVLDAGPIRIHAEGETHVFAARRGTLRTAGDRLTVLVESAVPVGEIDLAEVDARLTQLRERDGAGVAEERRYLAALRTVKERYG